MISFVQQSYSQSALFLIPVVVTIIGFLWKASKWPFIQKWLVTSAASAALYVIGSTLIEGLSAFIGLAFVFALIVQMPVSLTVGGLMVLFEHARNIRLR